MDRSRTKPTQDSRESGMTLIEVSLSMVVLGVVLVGLGQALTYGIKMNNDNKLRVANLNVCKYVTENLKTQISQSQAIFDGTDPGTATYYVDVDGNKTYSGTGPDAVEAATGSSAYRVNVVTSNSSLTKTVGGVTNVLVKVLTVTVVDVQNRNNVGHDVSVRVEIIRPSV